MRPSAGQCQSSVVDWRRLRLFCRTTTFYEQGSPTAATPVTSHTRPLRCDPCLISRGGRFAAVFETGECLDIECRSAHGKDELRSHVAHFSQECGRTPAQGLVRSMLRGFLPVQQSMHIRELDNIWDSMADHTPVSNERIILSHEALAPKRGPSNFLIDTSSRIEQRPGDFARARGMRRLPGVGARGGGGRATTPALLIGLSHGYSQSTLREAALRRKSRLLDADMRPGEN